MGKRGKKTEPPLAQENQIPIGYKEKKMKRVRAGQERDGKEGRKESSHVVGVDSSTQHTDNLGQNLDPLGEQLLVMDSSGPVGAKLGQLRESLFLKKCRQC